MNMVLIMAENLWRSKIFAEKLNLHNYRYVTSKHDFSGTENIILFRYGRWMLNDLYNNEVRNEIKCRRICVIDVSENFRCKILVNGDY